MTAIDQAVALQQGNDARRRWLLEALLLTQADLQEIAGRTDADHAAVGWYHDLFFDVRNRLTAGDWIMSVIRGERKRHALRPDDQEFFLKLYAYHGGALVLDEVLAYFDRAAPPVGLEERLRWLRVRAALLAHALPASGEMADLVYELRRLADSNRTLVESAESDISLLAPIRPAMSLDDLVRQFVSGGNRRELAS